MAMSEAPFSVTTKVGTDLLTVRGNTADEFVENLTNLNENPLFADALTAFQSIGGGVTVQQAVQNVQAAMPGTTEVGGTSGQLEVMTNAKGTKFTYGHPDAPDLARGGKFILMEGKNAKGPYRAWCDPVRGPKPATPVEEPEKTRWIN